MHFAPRIALAFLAIAVLHTGCRRREPQPSASVAVDAGAAPVASASAPPSDRTLRVVAESEEVVSGFVTADDRVVVVAGAFVYEAQENGELTVVGNLLEQESSDDALVGFVDPPRDAEVAGSLAEMLQLESESLSSTRRRFRLAGGKLRPTDAPRITNVARYEGGLVGIADGRLVSMNGAAVPVLPADAKPFGLAALRDGGLAAVVRKGSAWSVVVWGSAAEPIATYAIEGERNATCRMVPSFDGAFTVRCGPEWSWERGRSTFWRLVSGRLDRAYLAAPPEVTSASATAEGTLVVTQPGKAPPLACPLAADACRPLELATDAKAVERARYLGEATEVIERDSGKYWCTLRVDVDGQAWDELPEETEVIAARSEDDVWLLGRRGRWKALLHSRAGAYERASLPSWIDTRVLARNAGPPSPWTGHCDHLFVRLDGSKDPARAVDVAGARARSADIRAALAVPWSEDTGFPFWWWLVTGKLHDEDVVGVVVVRRDIEAPLAKMEQATERLVGKLAKNPMSRPQIHCTLPVLTAVLDETSLAR